MINCSAVGISTVRFAAAVLLAGAAFAASPSTPRTDFNRDIRPILSDHCFACHGPDDGQRQVNLRLDTKEGAFADRGGYKLIVPGDRAKSRLYQRINHEQEVARMPPPGFERKLGPQQVELIGKWIDEGAEWQTHWAYVPPKHPNLPAVQQKPWTRNPIDHFVLARLEQEGLRPAPEADKNTLLRRVTLDLTGLPPTPAELDAFLADKSSDAYERVVDHLLKSPHYGERMAMQWLDLARYADTHGYHIDSHRDMWHWRDWVIEAFNNNMPFDRFTVEQIAGDLLPNASDSQKLATGFNRNHMINFEGGAIPEEYQTEYVVDRIETTSNVWMAMTMGCARCHDHKYDPIKQKQFYEFFAFFNTIPEKGLDGRAGNAEPLLRMPTSGQQNEIAELKSAIKEKRSELPEFELYSLRYDWEDTAHATVPTPSNQGLVSHYEFEEHLADTSGSHRHGAITKGTPGFAPGRVGQAFRLDTEDQARFRNAADFETNIPFTLALWLRSRRPEPVGIMHKSSGGDERRGFEIYMEEAVKVPNELETAATLGIRLVNQWPASRLEVKTRNRLTTGDWHHLAFTYDGSGKAAGLQLLRNGKPEPLDIVEDSLSGSISTKAPLEIGGRNPWHPMRGDIDDLRIYNRAIAGNEAEALAIHAPVRALLAISSTARTCDKDDEIHEYFLRHTAPEPYLTCYADLKKLQATLRQAEKSVATSMVMDEMAEPRETFVLGRGDYRNHGAKVEPAVPSWLSVLPPGAPKNRLGLARWIVDPSHPLTARVTVNRYWQMYFGTGIVATAEDFGSQGEAPSHPQLLDWLATEFIRSGWDVKAMQKLIVTSATYRQSSQLSPALVERDPQNRLLARGPRFRLPAETVRDNALAASGLLNDAVGGPSVLPYQPPGLWEEMAFGGVYSAQQYQQSHGADLYRRGMYTFWKRTVPPASLSTFDAPDREKCTARRARTNTPLQALVLLNDPTYIEAARALAERVLTEADDDSGERIDQVYRLAMARRPTPNERDVLLTLLDQQRKTFEADPNAAQELLQVGESKPNPNLNQNELAAWTTLASTILNLDEAITKE